MKTASSLGSLLRLAMPASYAAAVFVLLAIGFWLPSTALSSELSLQLDPLQFRAAYRPATGASATPVDGGFYVAFYSDRLIGVPIDSDGARLFPNPLRLSGGSPPFPDGSPAVASAADQVVIAHNNGDQLLVTLQSPGEWRYVTSTAVGIGTGRPAAASGGEDALVVWRGSSGVFGTRIDPSLWPTVPTGTSLSTESATIDPAVAHADGPDAYLVVWALSNAIRGRIVDQDASPLGPTFTVGSATNPTALSASWNGTSFVVVWSRQNAVQAVRVSSAGHVEDGTPISVAGAYANSAQSGSRNGETLVCWIEGFNAPFSVRGTRLSPQGQVLDPGGFIIANGLGSTILAHRVASVTSDGSKFLVVWLEDYWMCNFFYSFEDVMCVTVSPGTPSVIGAETNLFTSAAQGQITASILGDGYWTAWLALDRSSVQMFAARRDAAGGLLDPEGIAVPDNGYTCWESGYGSNFGEPVLAGNALSGLVAWRHEYRTTLNAQMRIEYRTYNPGGTLGAWELFYNPYDIDYLQQPPVAATDGDRFLLSFTEQLTPGESRVRWAGINSAGGGLTDRTADLGSAEVITDAASNGSEFLISWTVAGNGRDAYVGRIDAAFQLVDADGIPLAVGAGDQTPVRLASDGEDYLAVWDVSGDLRAARIGANGIVLDPGGVLLASRQAAAPFDVDWDGQHYVVVWTDVESNDDVAFVQRVASDGTVPGVPVEVLRRPDNLIRCTVASRNDGSSLIAFTTHRQSGSQHHMGDSGYGILYLNPGISGVPANESPSVSLRAFPNPFRSATVLDLGLTTSGTRSLRILDPAGRLIKRFAADDVRDGRITWDGRGDSGEEVPAGVFFMELSSPTQTMTAGKLIKLP
jgi:hypothetical protein